MHQGEYRKAFPNEEYACHPIRVADEFCKSSPYGRNPISVATALLHDVCENTDANLDTFSHIFNNPVVAKAVFEKVGRLTVPAEFDKEEKQKWQVEQMAKLEPDEQHIKIFDHNDNVKTFPADWSKEKRLDYLIHSQNMLQKSTERLSDVGIKANSIYNEFLLETANITKPKLIHRIVGFQIFRRAIAL